MKRIITLWMMSLLMVLTVPAMAAMSTSKMRQHSRFLTDRMAYELNLSSSQYDDVYEVNYDFLRQTRYLIDDVVAGYTSALDEYYDYLDVRNDDLRWILTSSQYRRFLEKEYFYRPIYTTTSGSWGFRIYQIYSDITHFYFGKPSHYSSYKGAHYRTYFNNVSYYKQQHSTRYQTNDVYRGDFAVGKTMKKEQEQRRSSDSRPNSNNPKYNQNGNNSGSNNVSRPSNSSSSNKEGNGSVSRPNSSNQNQNNGNGNVNRPNNSNQNQNNGNVNSNQSSSRPNNSNSNVNSNSSNSSKNRTNSTSTRSSRSNSTQNSNGTRSNNSSNNSSSRSAKRTR
jgi:hypothetical protein